MCNRRRWACRRAAELTGDDHPFTSSLLPTQRPGVVECQVCHDGKLYRDAETGDPVCTTCGTLGEAAS